MAAATAMGLAWRGRADWEPSEQDLPSGPRRVGGLLAAVAIVLLWSQFTTIAHLDQLKVVAAVTAALTLVALLVYGFLIANQTYKAILFVPPQGTREQKIVGGFRLTEHAASQLRSQNVTVQELLAGGAYNPDKVWDRASRALAKQCFVICYLLLTVAGTATLAAIAIIVDVSTGT